MTTGVALGGTTGVMLGGTTGVALGGMTIAGAWGVFVGEGSAVAGIWRIRATRPFPHVAKHLLQFAVA